MKRALRGPLPRLLACAVLVCALPVARGASADPPDAALLERLSRHVKAIGEIGDHASFRVEAHLDELDRSGHVASTKVRESHVDSDGQVGHETVERAVKDGKDVTAEEQEKIRDAEARQAAKKKKGEKDDDSITLPFASDGYVYDQVAVDPRDPDRVEIAFKPKQPSKHTVEGSAWVAVKAGTVLSAGAKLSKPSLFVDWVHFTVECGAPTPVGPALSRLSFEGKGGLSILYRKHVRGTVQLRDYHLSP